MRGKLAARCRAGPGVARRLSAVAEDRAAASPEIRPEVHAAASPPRRFHGSRGLHLLPSRPAHSGRFDIPDVDPSKSRRGSTCTGRVDSVRVTIMVRRTAEPRPGSRCRPGQLVPLPDLLQDYAKTLNLVFDGAPEFRFRSRPQGGGAGAQMPAPVAAMPARPLPPRLRARRPGPPGLNLSYGNRGDRGAAHEESNAGTRREENRRPVRVDRHPASRNRPCARQRDGRLSLDGQGGRRAALPEFFPRQPGDRLVGRLVKERPYEGTCLTPWTCTTYPCALRLAQLPRVLRRAVAGSVSTSYPALS